MKRPPGTLYIIAAASGTGKTSLTKALAASIDNLKISISHTTRTIRHGEQADINYFFVDTSTFEEMIEANQFLEYAKVFDHYYGTSRAWVEKQLQSGVDILLDIDWQGARQIRNNLPCVSIFLLPPSRTELKHRLQQRKRDSEEVIAHRLEKASSEISHYHEFDYVVINNQFDVALQDLHAIIHSQKLYTQRQATVHAKLIHDLLEIN